MDDEVDHEEVQPSLPSTTGEEGVVQEEQDGDQPEPSGFSFLMATSSHDTSTMVTDASHEEELGHGGDSAFTFIGSSTDTPLPNDEGPGEGDGDGTTTSSFSFLTQMRAPSPMESESSMSSFSFLHQTGAVKQAQEEAAESDPFSLVHGRQSPGTLPAEQPPPPPEEEEEEPTTSAFSFLMEKSASPPPPSSAEPDFLGMETASTTSTTSTTKPSYPSSDLVDLLTLDAPPVTTTTTTPSNLSNTPMSAASRSSISSSFSPDHHRRSSSMKGGSSGDLMAGLSLKTSMSATSSGASPTPASIPTTSMATTTATTHVPMGSITFERTATARTNIKKKRQQVKVGYARDDPEVGGTGAMAAPHITSAPAPQTPTRSLSSPSVPSPSPGVTDGVDHYRLPTASSSAASNSGNAATRNSNRVPSSPIPSTSRTQPQGTVIVSAEDSPATRALQARHTYQSPPKPKVGSPPLASPGTRKPPPAETPAPAPAPEPTPGFTGFLSRMFGGGPKKEPEKPPTTPTLQPQPTPTSKAQHQHAPKLHGALASPSTSHVKKDIGASGGGGGGSEARQPLPSQPPVAMEDAGNFTDDTSQSSSSPRADDKDLDQDDNRQSLSSLPQTHNGATTPIGGPPVVVEEFKPQPPSAPPPHRKSIHEAPNAPSSAGAKFKRNPPSPKVTSPKSKPQPSASLPVDIVEKNRSTLETLIKEFQRDATHLCFRQQDTRRRLAKVAQDKAELQKEQATFREELKRYEAEQQRLAEREEFDKADALSQVIEQVKEQAAQRVQSLQAMTAEAEQLEKSLGESQGEQVKAMQFVSERLKGFLEARVVELDQYLDQARVTNETERKRLASEQKRIEMEIGHIHKEEVVMKDETVNVETSIESQTSDLIVRKEELQGKVSGVEEEIAKLEAILMAKKQERERLVHDLAGAESEIQKIRSKFDRQLQRLKEKERTLAKSRLECEAEEASLKKQKVTHEEACTAAKAEEARRKTLVQQAREELNAATELTASFLSQEQFQKDLEIDASQASLKERHDLQVQVAEAEKKASEMRKEYDGYHAKIVSLCEEVQSIDTRIPLLEHAKKEAAATKNYKEAGAKSKEIKALQVRREEAEGEIAQAKEGIDAMKNSVEEVETTLAERRAVLQSLEKEMEGRKAGILAKRARDLRRSKRALDKLQAARIHTSAEILLQAELEAVALEIEALRSRFGIEVKVAEDSDEDTEPQQSTEAPVTPSLPEEAKKEDVTEKPVVDGSQDDEVVRGAMEVPEESIPRLSKEPPGPDTIAKAKEMHLQIISLEDKLTAAVDAEDFELADEINSTMEALRAQIAELGIDVVSLILTDGSDGDDDGVEDEEEQEVEIPMRATDQSPPASPQALIDDTSPKDSDPVEAASAGGPKGVEVE